MVVTAFFIFLFAKFGAHVKIWTFRVKNSMIVWKKKQKNSKKNSNSSLSKSPHFYVHGSTRQQKKKLKDV
jgi:hypothetical protein